MMPPGLLSLSWETVRTAGSTEAACFPFASLFTIPRKTSSRISEGHLFPRGRSIRWDSWTENSISVLIREPDSRFTIPENPCGLARTRIQIRGILDRWEPSRTGQGPYLPDPIERSTSEAIRITVCSEGPSAFMTRRRMKRESIAISSAIRVQRLWLSPDHSVLSPRGVLFLAAGGKKLLKRGQGSFFGIRGKRR